MEALFCRRGLVHGTLTLISVFINVSVWWYAVALLLADMGKIFDLKTDGRPIYRNISISLFVIATGLLFWGASTYILAAAPYRTAPLAIPPLHCSTSYIRSQLQSSLLLQG
ncbi:DUF373 family protein [Methanosarcina horonobensis]|uniref:DUF373 family protein n=1 Tax=Methanosarcina horonobensis TaxID=418008 RepID=UPI000AE3EA97